ncbi:MAG: hypothetical protein R2756_15940 [Bacteroidales bacterium]
MVLLRYSGCVDEGRLRLDDPVRNYIPGLDSLANGQMMPRSSQ